jgi:Domain of unknown function (DUF3516)
LGALELLGQESERDPLDVLRVVEAILDDPFPVLMAQANQARGEAVAAMKADGIEYEQRMELLDEVTYPKLLDDGLRQAFDSYRARVRESDLSPKSVVRDMYEQGRTFTEFIGHYGLSRSEGLTERPQPICRNTPPHHVAGREPSRVECRSKHGRPRTHPYPTTRPRTPRRPQRRV